jgi:hypothetical protein
MAYIAKLVCNRLGWTVPSGLDAKSDNTEYGPFEAHHHFGFEEWLFNEQHKINIKGETYFFGFVECFRNDSTFTEIDVLHLGTELFRPITTQRYVGYITYVSPVSEEEYRTILDHHPNIVDRMRNELIQALTDDDILDNALSIFNRTAEEGSLFNCKFIHGYRYNCPIANTNWHHLNHPFGVLSQLPKNFAVNTISIETIEKFRNYRRVPRIL